MILFDNIKQGNILVVHTQLNWNRIIYFKETCYLSCFYYWCSNVLKFMFFMKSGFFGLLLAILITFWHFLQIFGNVWKRATRYQILSEATFENLFFIIYYVPAQMEVELCLGSQGQNPLPENSFWTRDLSFFLLLLVLTSVR